MKISEVRKLKHGLYLVHWKPSHGGGTSLAAVGSYGNGDRWLAPTNWIAIGGHEHAARNWRAVEKMQLLQLIDKLRGG